MADEPHNGCRREEDEVDRLLAPLRLMARAKEFRTCAEIALDAAKQSSEASLMLAGATYAVGAELCVGLSRLLVLLDLHEPPTIGVEHGHRDRTETSKRVQEFLRRR